MQERILIIDDDADLTGLLEEFLEPNGFFVKSKYNGKSGVEFLIKNEVDLIILDIMLPDIDGFQVLKKIRSTLTTPVIMLTAKGETTDRIVGLELGADDYLSKPFEPKELLARIRSILRRSKAPAEMLDIIEFEGLLVDKMREEAKLDESLLQLSTTEFEALVLFVEHSGQVLDREFLVEHTRGIPWQSYDRSIDVLVSRLRVKLGETPISNRFIKTIHGIGYKFVGKPKT